MGKKKIGNKVANWVESQKDIAEEMGVTVPTINSMLNGKMKFPLTRFIQIVYLLNPPQNEVNEVTNIYLGELGIPENSIIITHTNTAENGTNNISISSNGQNGSGKLPRLIDAIMDSDLSDEVKVKVYHIIKSIK
jgi:hypothetical protein